MKRKHYEKPQSRNMHQLTIDQHILPRRSIERFCGQDGTVRVKRIGKEGFIDVPPKNRLFCAKRAWDQRAETTLSWRTEASFQRVADAIVGLNLLTLEPEAHMAVTEMYLLWRHRALFARDPLGDQVVNMVEPERDLSIDSQEILEKKGILFIRPDRTIPGRALAGIAIQMAIGRDLEAGADKMHWGVVRAPQGLEFIVPDAFINQPIMPVAPNVCLVSGLPDGQLSLPDVGMLNREALNSAHAYWFAKAPERCPV